MRGGGDERRRWSEYEGTPRKGLQSWIYTTITTTTAAAAAAAAATATTDTSHNSSVDVERVKFSVLSFRRRFGASVAPSMSESGTFYL